LLIVGVAIALGVAAWASVTLFYPVRRGPKLLNEPTAAREVRPFTTAPDPRFAPLPLEREKHEK
jgi:hypothetical protein